jgi:hypothetical protein
VESAFAERAPGSTTGKNKRFVTNHLSGGKVFPENSRLTSPPAGPTLQSQTGFGGCDAVGSDSPIKRNPACAGVLEAGKRVLIRKNEHFLFTGWCSAILAIDLER